MSHTDEILTRIAVLRVPQRRVAVLAGYDATWFSRALAGIRKLPPDFEWRVDAVLGAIKEAQDAHDRTLAAALERKIAEHELLHRKRIRERHDEHPKGCGEAPAAWTAVGVAS